MPERSRPDGRESMQQVYRDLTAGCESAVQAPDVEQWSELIQTITVAGRIHAVTEETYYYFLEVLPPKLQRGSFYAFAEGQEPLRIFWTRGGQYYCRQLSDDETLRVCRTSGLPLDYGSM
jgi:hypothetical protein